MPSLKVARVGRVTKLSPGPLRNLASAKSWDRVKMMLKRSRGVLSEYPMKRRFCETSIMSEYHSMKPYFIGVNDDGPACPQDSSYPNDEMWKKFELFLTPPSSPEHSRENNFSPPKPDPVVCALTSDAALAEALESIEEMDMNLKSSDFVEDDPAAACPDKACDCTSDEKLIKDCMWNGFGHNRTKRVPSPVPARSPCHANGCVDPRNIFPYPVGQPTCCENQRKRRFPSPIGPTIRHRPAATTDGAETPSDSEEEIDVVTVESKQTINLLKPKSGAAGAKIMGTLVSRENGELTLVTTSSSTNQPAGKELKSIPDLQELKTGDSDRGRPRNKQIHVLCAANGNGSSLKEVAMLIERQGGVAASKDVQQVKLQVKNLTRPSGDVTKRRNTTDACCAGDKTASTQLMRLANPKAVMQRNNSVSPVPASGVKRRILSLDGISFSATTGARQYTTEYNRQKETAPAVALGSALRSAQENAISITAVRGKPKIKPIPNNMSGVNVEPDTTGIQAHVPTSPQSKRKRKDMVSASSASGSDSEHIRAAHNVLERQRREGLRASFHRLRDNVPELQNLERTPKVNILNKARDYCLEITKKETTLLAEKERLRKRQERLQQRLQRLQETVDTSEPGGSDFDFDLTSDNEYQSNEEDVLLSPESSLPPSLPPSPNAYAPVNNTGYYIARRLSSDDCKSMPQPEVVFRLETTCDAKSHQNPANQRKRKLVLSQAHFQGGDNAKQVKYSAELQALIASLQTKTNLPVLTSQNSGGLSDGYEELYDSEEDSVRFEMTGNQIGHVASY